jgi:hypothetical protein
VPLQVVDMAIVWPEFPECSFARTDVGSKKSEKSASDSESDRSEKRSHKKRKDKKKHKRKHERKHNDGEREESAVAEKESLPESPPPEVSLVATTAPKRSIEDRLEYRRDATTDDVNPSSGAGRVYKGRGAVDLFTLRCRQLHLFYFGADLGFMRYRTPPHLRERSASPERLERHDSDDRPYRDERYSRPYRRHGA